MSHSTAGVFWLKSSWRDKWNRILKPRKKLMIPSGIILAAAIIAGGVYFYSAYSDKIGGGSDDLAASLPAEWLVKYFRTGDENDPRVGGLQGDPDDDVLTNLQEYFYGTDPTKEDTDGDGEIDSYEVAFGQNPNGDNELVPTDAAQDYLKELIESDERYAEFSQENIAKEVASVLKPDQAVVFDFPADSELIISRSNEPKAFEKYFEEVKGLMIATDADYQNVQTRLFDGMSDEEIDGYIDKLRATEDALKKIPVPSDIVNIQKLKIAGLRAGVGMFEIVRDQHSPDAETPEFWTMIFNKIVAIDAASSAEMAAWNELGNFLKDTGGIEEIQK